MIINSSSRSSSSNRGQIFFLCTKNSFRIDGLFFLGEVCSRLVAVGALVGSMDKFSLFLLVAGSLVSFVFGSGDCAAQVKYIPLRLC